MARIRTIKPEFWVSVQVVSCSRDARLLFIGIWNFCDDNGIHIASHFNLKMQVFPGDNCSVDDIKKWITELIDQGLVREYYAEDKAYWQVTGWHKHQKIDRPTSKHPTPQPDSKLIGESSTTNNQELDDNSTSPPRLISDLSATTRRALDDSSPPEGKGRERKGKDKDICEVETSLVCDSGSLSASNSVNAAQQEVFQYWQEIMDHPRAKLDNKRRHKITQALNLGYQVSDLRQAIEGCKKTAFNMGQNERGQRYDDLELILRDASHIDHFIANASNSIPAAESNSLMRGVE